MKRPELAAGERPPRQSAVSRKRTVDSQRRATWIAGFQYSTFSLVMAGVLVVAVVTLVPRLQEVISQRQQIAALESEIELTSDEIEQMQSLRERWNDKTFLATQARERLFYVLPGEVSFLVINDLPPSQLVEENQQVSDSVQAFQGDWLTTVIRSVVTAGLSQTVPVAPEPTPSTEVTQ